MKQDNGKRKTEDVGFR